MHRATPASFSCGLVTLRFAETCEFYCRHLGFAPVEVTADFALLARDDGSRLGVLHAGGEGQPAALRTPTRGAGLWVRVEVDDVDGVHTQFVAERVEIVADPEFTLAGERRCIARDPNGVLVYIQQRQPPAPPLTIESTTHQPEMRHHHEDHSNRVHWISRH